MLFTWWCLKSSDSTSGGATASDADISPRDGSARPLMSSAHSRLSELGFDVCIQLYSLIFISVSVCVTPFSRGFVSFVWVIWECVQRDAPTGLAQVSPGGPQPAISIPLLQWNGWLNIHYLRMLVYTYITNHRWPLYCCENHKM